MLTCVLSHFSQVRLFSTLRTPARRAPQSVGSSRQEYWSGCHALLQGVFPTQGSSPSLFRLLHWQASNTVAGGKPTCVMSYTQTKLQLDTRVGYKISLLSYLRSISDTTREMRPRHTGDHPLLYLKALKTVFSELILESETV